MVDRKRVGPKKERFGSGVKRPVQATGLGMADGVLVGPGWGRKVSVWAGLVPDLRLQNGALAGQWGDGGGVCLTPEHFGANLRPCRLLSL